MNEERIIELDTGAAIEVTPTPAADPDHVNLIVDEGGESIEVRIPPDQADLLARWLSEAAAVAR
jgi:hypothetical protein